MIDSGPTQKIRVVVTVASIAHHDGSPKLLEQNPKEGYRSTEYYGNSKLANLLFTAELQRRLDANGIATLAMAVALSLIA